MRQSSIPFERAVKPDLPGSRSHCRHPSSSAAATAFVCHEIVQVDCPPCCLPGRAGTIGQRHGRHENAGRQRGVFTSLPMSGTERKRIALRGASKRFPAPIRQRSVSIPAGHCHFSPALRLASSAASHGLIWPGPASPRPALPQRLMQTFFPWAAPIPRETRKSARRRPPLRSGSLRTAAAGRAGPVDRHRGRDGRGLESQKEN